MTTDDRSDTRNLNGPDNPRPPIRLDVADWSKLSGDALYALLEKTGRGDGLPPATVSETGLDAFLANDAMLGIEEVAVLPPLNRVATLESIAVCCLLAGCVPEHLPVLVAAIKALADPAFNAMGVLTTTGNAALAMVLSGPLGSELRFNAGASCLGPGGRSNAVVGRALQLIARNIAGVVPGVTDMATMGQPAKYGMCFLENQEANPWPSLHVDEGFAAGDSTVTLFAASGAIEVTSPDATSAQNMLDTLAASMCLLGSVSPHNALIAGGRPTLLLSPEWVSALHKEGLSKTDVKAELHRRAAWAVVSLPRSLQESIHRRWTGTDPPRLVRAAARPEDVMVVVAGGVGIKQTLIPGWAGGSRPVTVRIER